MASESSQVLNRPERRERAGRPRRMGIRLWAWAAVVAQVAFVASWAVAGFWQGTRYSPMADSISDMYAVGVPHAGFLTQVFTDAGAATILFALFSVWPALRDGGRAAKVGSVLLALSVAGLGNLLSPAERLACRISDPGCTTARQLSNSGGKLDSVLTTGGAVLLVVAGFLIASAMRRIPVWRAWARPVRWMSVLIFALVVVDALDGTSGQGGLIERLYAAVAAAALTALAVGILRRARH